MSNSFAEHQKLYLSIKLLSITRNISICGESWSLLVAWREGYLAETTKNTNRKWNSDLRGEDVIECEDCRETITWCSRCVE